MRKAFTIPKRFVRGVLHILIGWGKAIGLLQVTPAEQKLSALRLEKCRRCARSKQVELLELIQGEAIYENTLICTLCKCPCLQKTLVADETCPINKW